MATLIATLTIATFFISSLVAELNGEEALIKSVKEAIFYSLPILFVAMPALGISGNKLAGNAKSPIILAKQRRMKFIVANGLILTTLACLLYYRAHYQAIDGTFLALQLAEFAFGLANLSLIGLNIKAGRQLAGRGKEVKVVRD